MALDDIRLAVFTRPSPSEETDKVKITHEWDANGVRKSFSIRIEEPSGEFGYTVNPGPRNIENRVLILSCPR